MKRRLPKILAISIALILIGSLAYAQKKKEQAKSMPDSQEISEEEALKKELLGATEERQKKVPSIDETRKETAEEVKVEIIAKPPKKKGIPSN